VEEQRELKVMKNTLYIRLNPNRKHKLAFIVGRKNACKSAVQEYVLKLGRLFAGQEPNEKSPI
jgi:hypothetical protein